MKYIEFDHQCAVVKWFDDLQSIGKIPDYYLFYANRNTQTLNPKQQGRAKREGMRSGIPDLFLAATTSKFSGLYIEMKNPDLKPKTARSKGGLSDLQILNIIKLEKCGYKVEVCYGAIEATKVISEYLQINT